MFASIYLQNKIIMVVGSGCGCVNIMMAVVYRRAPREDDLVRSLFLSRFMIIIKRDIYARWYKRSIIKYTALSMPSCFSDLVLSFT